MTIVFESALDVRHYQEQFRLSCAAPAPFVRPGERGLFVRRPNGSRGGASPDGRYEAALGRWGLIPLFAETPDYPATFEARGETAAGERDFLLPWKRGHRCIVLADALFRRGESDQRMVRVTRVDGRPLALAGLWNGWRAPDGACVESFALLTLPSEEQPGERRAVFLREGWLDDWLYCPVEEAAACLRPYDLGKLLRTPVDGPPPRDAS